MLMLLEHGKCMVLTLMLLEYGSHPDVAGVWFSPLYDMFVCPFITLTSAVIWVFN